MNIVEQFKAILNERALTGAQLQEKYNHIWKMNEPLQAMCYLMPKTTEEVSQILKICNDNKQNVVTFGGVTNLVGSTETTVDDVVLSLEKMNQIEEVDASSRTITCQAGVILEEIHKATDELNLIFPLNFGARGSAQVGGFISTNAGGLRVLRYGMTRALVLGLEVVLPDGTIVNSMKKIIKDNSAYDIKQNFIGAEGTLGVITRAILKLEEKPKSRVTTFMATNDYDNVVKLLKLFDQKLSGKLSGFELIWKDTYINQTKEDSIFNPVLPQTYEYYILTECLGDDQAKDEELVQNILEQAMIDGLIEDGAFANTESDLVWFWGIREEVHLMNQACVIDQHFDISIPIPTIGATVAKIKEELMAIPEVTQAFAFGHVADGNIHFIVDKPNDSVELKERIDNVVYGPLMELGGSVSAEHGIGNHKKKYLKLCRNQAEIEVMRRLKQTFDPNNILNRGKVLV